MGKTNKGPKMKKFDPSKAVFDYTKTSYMFGFRPLNIRSAAQEKMDPQPLESDRLCKPAPFYPPGISREGAEERREARKRKQEDPHQQSSDVDSSDDSDDDGSYSSRVTSRRPRLRSDTRENDSRPNTSFKLRVPLPGKKKVKSDAEFLESLLDSCQKWLSPANAVKRGLRELERKDVVWKDGDDHKVIIIAIGVAAQKMARKAVEVLHARGNTTILHIMAFGPREHDSNGEIKEEVMNKAIGILKKNDVWKPKILFLLTRNCEGAMYGLRNGITQAMAEEVHTTIDAEENSEMTDIIDWRMKDIRKGLLSQYVIKGTIHGIVLCGAPSKVVRPGQPADPAAHSNEYPQYRDVFRRLSDILDTFDEPVQDGLAVEDDYIVHLKNVITTPQEILRTIGEKFKDLDCDRRIITRTPPVDSEAMGLMFADLICCREFAQCPLLDPIELGNHEFPLVLMFSDGHPTDDHPYEEDRHLKVVMHCLKILKRKQFLRGFTLLSAKFVNSKAEGVFITNEDLSNEETLTEFQTGMWEDYNDGDNLIGYTGLEGCEYTVHVLSLFR